MSHIFSKRICITGCLLYVLYVIRKTIFAHHYTG